MRALSRLHCVLFQPKIAGNTGNMGRTCLAFGATLHLIEPLGFSLDEKAVRRAGIDHWKHVPLKVHKSWEAFEADGPKGHRFFFSKSGGRSLFQVSDELAVIPSSENLILVFGNEVNGLDDLDPTIKSPLVHLPMLNGDIVRSLNLSNCASIVLWEAFKSRQTPV